MGMVNGEAFTKGSYYYNGYEETDSLFNNCVTKNIEQGMVAVGNPAKAVCHTERITDNVTGEKVYPWQYTFDRGMPWQDIGYEKWEKEQQRYENNAEQA